MNNNKIDLEGISPKCLQKISDITKYLFKENYGKPYHTQTNTSSIELKYLRTIGTEGIVWVNIVLGKDDGEIFFISIGDNGTRRLNTQLLKKIFSSLD